MEKRKKYNILNGSNKIVKDMRKQYNQLQRKKIYIENNMHSDSDRAALAAAEEKRQRRAQKHISQMKAV